MQHNEKQLISLPECAKNDRSGWSRRHFQATLNPKEGAEFAIVGLIRAWLCYADSHHASYGCGIGQDGVLGECWSKIGNEIRGLLNGDLGRLDGGTLDGILCRILTEQGFDPDSI